MKEKERKKNRKNKDNYIKKSERDFFPLTVDETPETVIMERGDDLTEWFKKWLNENVYIPKVGIPLKKILYGAEGDAKKELGYGSAVTFRRYLNGYIWCTDPLYEIYSFKGKKFVRGIYN